VVDFFSPYARRDLPVAPFRPVRFGPYIPYCSSEIDTIVHKLETAAAMLNEINPVTASFVRVFAKTVVPRKEALNPDFFTSSSCNAYIGRIVLINPHLAYVDESSLIDALVHESIHSLLWRVELLNPFIVDLSKVKGTTRSPWTGSELHLYTFLQACFVWFGLWTFWSTPKAQELFPAALVAKYVARARKGFEENRVIANVMKFKDALRPGLLNELESMQAQACSVN
jgi:HEXXH motif-containing protein